MVGGRNGNPAGTNFIIDLELFAFSNAVPEVLGLATSTAISPNMLNVDFQVNDVDGDGGYAFMRFRQPPTISWSTATINSQITPAGTTLTPPTFEVTPGSNTFVWNFTNDGVPTSTVVEIELLPFGAVIGSTTRFIARTPGP